MSATEVAMSKRPLERDDHKIPRKRFKATELPLSPTQRSVIDSLLHTFKKKGEFDTLRKKVWNQYSESADKTTFITSLEKLAEDEIDRDPSLLSRERGKAATLMLQGAVETSDIYKSVESSLDRFLAEHIGHVETTIREIRRAEVGPDIAAEEQSRANKTDEEYAAEAAVRRLAREEQQKKDEARKRREEEKEMLRAEEAKKKAELEKLRRREKRRNEEAERAVAREAHLALLKKSEEELERKRQERREGHGREDIDRHSVKEQSRERVRSAHREPGPPPPRQDTAMPDAVSPKTPAAPPIDEKDLEAIALERLLDESLKASNNKSNIVDLRKGQSMKGFKPGEPSPPKGPASDRTHSPLNIEPPKGPRLSYSQPKRPLYSPHPLETRTRSRSPSRSHSHHDIPRRDSADLRRPYDSEAKAAWKKQAISRGEEEGEYRKPTSTRERSPTRDRDDEHAYHGYYEREEHPQKYYTERDRDHDRYKDREHKDPDRYREREREREKEYRSSRHTRSRSPDRRDRDRDRESYRERENYSHRDHDRSERDRYRDRDREPHRSHRDRSRSPTTRSSHTKPYDTSTHIPETRSSRPGERQRAKSPVEIDRYVPSTSIRARDVDKARHSHDGHEEKGRDKERDAYTERERPSTREGHKDRDRERGERGERYKEKDEYRRERDGREKHGERDGREKKGYVEIDRYVPGSSSRAKELEFPRGRDGERERERDRDRERPRERERE